MSVSLESVLEKIRRAELTQFSGVPLDGPNVRSPLSGETPLHIVAIWGDVDSALALLEAGAEVDIRGEEDCTPLHEAIMQGHAEVARLLLSRGADPRLKCRFGDAYEIAARSESGKIKVLFESSA